MRKSVKSLVIIFLAIVLVSGGFLVANLMPEKNNYDEYKTQSSSSEKSILETPTEELADNPIDFLKLKEENNEVVGWIQIPNMVIDYPILQSGPETAEDFYLDKDMYKKKKSAGSIYIQKMNFADFSDPNTLIYGHNMLNGSMFGTLKKFRNKQFFDENDTIKIYTPGQILTYKIYSAFVYDSRHILASFDFRREDDYQKFIDITLNPDAIVQNVREGVEVTTKDKIITLSTCTNDDNERYLVVAVLVDSVNTK